jgi:hypothetical protein
MTEESLTAVKAGCGNRGTETASRARCDVGVLDRIPGMTRSVDGGWPAAFPDGAIDPDSLTGRAA